jgi:hypothetical protein
MIRPNTVISMPICTITNQIIDDTNKEQSQKKAAAIKIIILIGSWATVNVNIANAGPKARNAHPKNSGKVMTKFDNL